MTNYGKLDDWKAKLNTWIVYAVIATSIAVILTFKFNVEDASTRNYILSAISQGLAAIFAFGTSLTFIFSQALQGWETGNKEKPLHILPFILPLLLIYAIGIVAPIIAMQTGGEMSLDLCVSWSSFCIFILIPYLIYVRDRAKELTDSEEL